MPTDAQAPESLMTYRQAVNAALVDVLEADGSTILMGEDVASAGGVFKTNNGLVERFGAERVINTPICENGFVGVALGMAATGVRPIVEIMFSDFLPTAGDAIVNELPKFRFMSGGQFSVPVTIRAIGGAGGRFGTQHSATGESWFLQVAGLRLAAAGTPAAAYGLIRAAVADPNPTIVFEHKAMYGHKGPVQRGPGGVAELGRASIEREGGNVTIVASLLMVERALKAAEQLAASGIGAEVIDVRWLRPLDYPTIRRSVEKTRRLVVASEEYRDGSWAASLIARLGIEGVTLRTPPRIVGLPDDLPMPYSPPLEDALIPSAAAIAAAAI